MERALSNLRHLYKNMVNGAVRDTASSKRIADGLLSPAIQEVERTLATYAHLFTDEIAHEAASAIPPDAVASLKKPNTKEEAHFLSIVLLATIHNLREEWKLEEL